MRFVRPLISLATLAVLGAGLACRKPEPKPEPRPEPPQVAPTPPKVEERPTPPPAADTGEAAALAAYRAAAEAALKDINFDYDKSDIREADKPRLQSIAGFMKQYAQARLSIEGHCDERGTMEYNMALGERRAYNTQRYLVSLGVPESRLSTISFGKERPKMTGHEEQSWFANRRSEFKLK